MTTNPSSTSSSKSKLWRQNCSIVSGSFTSREDRRAALCLSRIELTVCDEELDLSREPERFLGLLLKLDEEGKLDLGLDDVKFKLLEISLIV